MGDGPRTDTLSNVRSQPRPSTPKLFADVLTIENSGPAPRDFLRKIGNLWLTLPLESG